MSLTSLKSKQSSWEQKGLPSYIPPHLIPLGPDGKPLFKSTNDTQTSHLFATSNNQSLEDNSSPNITSRFPFLSQATTTTRPRTNMKTKNRITGNQQSLLHRVINRMTQDPDVRDGMMNGMMAVAPIAMMAIISSVDLPALFLAPLAAVLPSFLFGAIGESNLSVSPSTGIQGSHTLNLTLGGEVLDQGNMEPPQPPSITSEDPLADEMAETLYPHLHGLLELLLG